MHRDVDFRGIVVALGLLGLAAFFGLAALVSIIAVWRTGNRPRWMPRFLVSLAFGGACLLSINLMGGRIPWAERLDQTVWLWAPLIIVLWLLANRSFGRWARKRGAFPRLDDDAPTD